MGQDCDVIWKKAKKRYLYEPSSEDFKGGIAVQVLYINFNENISDQLLIDLRTIIDIFIVIIVYQKQFIWKETIS